MSIWELIARPFADAVVRESMSGISAWSAPRMIEFASRRLADDQRAARREEWTAQMLELRTANLPLRALLFGFGVVIGAVRIRARQRATRLTARLTHFGLSAYLSVGEMYSHRLALLAQLVLVPPGAWLIGSYVFHDRMPVPAWLIFVLMFAWNTAATLAVRSSFLKHREELESRLRASAR